MPHIDHGHTVRPAVGEFVSGDTAVICEQSAHTIATVVDVLGHGRDASGLARKIAEFLRTKSSPDVVDTMIRLHEHIALSRGAGAGICAIELATGKLHYAGIGNTVIRRIGRTEGRLISRDGVLGAPALTSRLRPGILQELQLEPDDLVLLYSDGVKTNFDMRGHPSLRARSVKALSEAVIKQFGKDHDDASCIALRYRT